MHRAVCQFLLRVEGRVLLQRQVVQNCSRRGGRLRRHVSYMLCLQRGCVRCSSSALFFSYSASLVWPDPVLRPRQARHCVRLEASGQCCRLSVVEEGTYPVHTAPEHALRKHTHDMHRLCTSSMRLCFSVQGHPFDAVKVARVDEVSSGVDLHGWG